MIARGAVKEDARYWAFISYSHKNADFGRKLHRRLESYSLPHRLVGRVVEGGTVPRRLAPIFRDREEFPAAGDLSAQVRGALQLSRSLIVVCSPAAASSQWVAREVETFRALHPDGPVLAAVVEGEPENCFPAALLAIGADGTRTEPLAADFRPHRDGAGLGLLKLVAGVVGVGLDELVQRDAQRRTRRVMAVTAIALCAVVIMAALSIVALRARAEAVLQRGEAESLVEFMLTDLRERLKGVGRLDVMAAVNQRALHYYSDQDLSGLAPQSLERRARILHAMGEDDETRGDHAAAQAKFREAGRTTAALLAQAPDDAERIFTHAQSEYWMAYLAYSQGQFAAAMSAFANYKRLAERLLSIAPKNPRYRRELAYADSNLCTVTLEEAQDTNAALRYCGQALVQTMEAGRYLKHSAALVNDLIERHAWLSDAYRAAGNLRRARAERQEEEDLLNGLLATDPDNMDLRDTWISLQRALAALDRQEGNKGAAQTRLERALAAADAMHRHDPANQQWTALRTKVRTELRRVQKEELGYGIH